MNYSIIIRGSETLESDSINDNDVATPSVRGLPRGHRNPRYSVHAARVAVAHWNGLEDATPNHRRLQFTLREDVS